MCAPWYRRSVRWVVCALLVAAPASALAWTEARPISAEGRAVAHPDGTADVTYRVVFQIDAGWFRGFTLAGLPAGVEVDPNRGRAIDEGGEVYDVRVRNGTGNRRGTFWVDLDTRRGIGRGQLVVELSWTAPLRVTHGDDGTVWEWETPPWSNGLNGVTATLDLPFPGERVEVVRDGPAADDAEAEPIEAAQGALETSSVEAIDDEHCRVTLSTFRLPRWSSLRVRARVMPDTSTAATAPTVIRRPGRPRTLVERLALPGIAGAVLLAMLLALGKRWSTRAVARRAGAVALDAVLPGLGRLPRFILAAALVAAGLAIQLPPIGQITGGLACILAAATLLARRYERALVARPPGRWTALGPHAARERLQLAKRHRARLGSIFDATSGLGFLVFGGTVAAVVWGAGRLQPTIGWLAWTLALDALAIAAPLWLGATRRHLPPDLAGVSARMLLRYGRRAKRLLRKCGGGEFSILGRVVGEEVDELRLELVPALRPDGLVAVELGVEVWCRTARLAAIVRAVEGSPADELTATLRGVVERHRAPDGATTAVVLLPGADGHASLFRDLRRALRTLAKAAPSPAPPEATAQTQQAA